MKTSCQRWIYLLLLFTLSTQSAISQSLRRSSFRVESPASIQGYKVISEIYNTGPSPWGTGINGTWENIPVAYDLSNQKGCLPFAANYFTGKFALLDRGDCEYGSKALAAQNAGAIGVIIVNNLLGVQGMGAATYGAMVNIPVVMVSNESGAEMKNQLLNNNVVTISLTAWRFDSIINPVDIGFMNDGPILPQGKAIPQHQVSVLALNSDEEFRLFSGGRIYNFSYGAFDSIRLKGKLSYNSNFLNGNFSPIDSNIFTKKYIPPISSVDSLIFIKVDSINGVLAGFDLDNMILGRYQMENDIATVPFTETNSASFNNRCTFHFSITDSIYSKCEYDFSKNAPVANNYIAVSALDNYEWGPVFYIRNGCYKALESQIVIMRSAISDSIFPGQQVQIKLRKWEDWNLNGVMDVQEIEPAIAQSIYQLTASDVVPISGLSIKMPFANMQQPGSPVVLESNSYYWMTITMGNGNTFAIGTDYFAEYTPTLNGQGYTKGNPVFDYLNGIVYGGGFQNAGSPSVALHTSKNIDDSIQVVATATPSQVCLLQSSILSTSNNYPYSSTTVWNPYVGGAVTPYTTTTYTVTTTSSDGCAVGTASVTLTVNPLPTIQISVLPMIMCLGDSAILNASGAVNYTWGGGLGTGNPKIVIPSVSQYYNVVGSDINGCTSNATVAVYVDSCLSCDSDIVISNSFFNYFTQSQTYIQTSGTVILGANYYVKFDAAPNSYVLLNPGFQTISGSVFSAQAYNGCATGVPQRPVDTSASEHVLISRDADYRIYPNPTSGRLIIEYPEGVSNARLLDFMGKAIMNIPFEPQVQRYELDISHLSNGIYFLHFDGNFRVKLSKQ